MGNKGAPQAKDNKTEYSTGLLDLPILSWNYQNKTSLTTPHVPSNILGEQPLQVLKTWRAGEIAQLVKCSLAAQTGEPKSVLRTHMIKLGTVVHSHNPSAGKPETSRSLVLPGQPTLPICELPASDRPWL